MSTRFQPSTRRRFLRTAGALLSATVAVAISTACGGSVTTAGSTTSVAPATTVGSTPTTTMAQATTAATSSAASSTGSASTSARTAMTTTGSVQSTSAASTSAATSASTAASAPAGKTLQYWTWWNSSNGSFKGWWEFVKPDYEAKHPGQTLDITFVPDDGNYETKLLAATAGGTPPDALHLDIVFAWDTWKHGVLADLSSFSAQTPSVGPDQ